MAKIDEMKEEINYLKFWLGIIVVTNIGLISWFVNNYDNSVYKSLSAMIAIFILTITIVILNKKIKLKIKMIGEL